MFVSIFLFVSLLRKIIESPLLMLCVKFTRNKKKLPKFPLCGIFVKAGFVRIEVGFGVGRFVCTAFTVHSTVLLYRKLCSYRFKQLSILVIKQFNNKLK